MTSQLPPKLYFRIGEVASLVGVEPHVLRYWEREFRTIRPTKSAKGQRVYSRRDVENLMRVRQLLYAEGFTIAGAKKKLMRPADGADGALEPETEMEEMVSVNAKAHAHVHVQARAPEPVDSGASRMRETLAALRSEIEAFLEELGG